MGIWRLEPWVLNIEWRFGYCQEKIEKCLPLSRLRKRAAFLSPVRAGRED